MIPDTFYHIYNRGNNREKIFFTRDNYIFFLKNFDKYLSDVLNVYSFCLLPNHFHFIIKTKSEQELFDKCRKSSTSKIISEHFKNFFMSFAKAINKQEGRTGSLFENQFHKKVIENDNYLLTSVLYVHLNPLHHHLFDDYEEYEWSSYKRIINDRPTKIMRKEILNLFGGVKSFIDLHRERKNILVLSEFENE